MLLYKYRMAALVIVRINNPRRVILVVYTEALAEVDITFRELLIRTITRAAMRYLFYYTKQTLAGRERENTSTNEKRVQIDSAEYNVTSFKLPPFLSG